MPHLVELRPEETHELRRAVLRAGTPTTEVAFDGDDDDSTFHLGVELDGRVVAIATWLEREFAPLPGRPAYQLRGMATAPDHRGHGSAVVLLHAGVDVCRARHAELIWARARDTALPFYEHHGYRTLGDGFVDDATELPHHHVVLEL